ncbi:trypsin-like serine peptidase [Microbispora triticiradicis]|uniref:trypsin-like serine peptidase n=1 Tax=Microbispora triticiradicis TaxID=2200763 RepID=UPI001059161E|nr:hypothetical protein [Microbispora triticiradicis]GLW22568.1 hypothetical protein Mame01_26110 [Microbispora amethystogenes]
MALTPRRVMLISLACAILLPFAATPPASAHSTARHKTITLRTPEGLTGFKKRAVETSKMLTPQAAADAKPLEIVPRPDKSPSKGRPNGPAGYVPPTAVGGQKVATSPAPHNASPQKVAPLAASVNMPITVGKIFIYKQATDEWVYCSGTVVTNQYKNLVATAGHCIIDPATGEIYKYWAFVPSYNDGSLRWPYGNWIPYVATVYEDWAVFEDPDYDYGFVNVSRPDGETGEPSGVRIGDFVGAQGLAYNQGIDLPGYIFAYPHAPHLDGDKVYSGWTMKWCYGTIGQLAPYQGADYHVGWGPAINNQLCAMTPGADGGPFLWQYSNNDNPLLRVGYLNSVISRVRDTDGNQRYDTWTGPYFDGDTKYLYDLAAARWSP